ncbi:MAG TPA: hypothetical protein VI248_01905 [Kineosporiaceae bacterium]
MRGISGSYGRRSGALAVVVAVLAACGGPVAGTGSDAPVPPGTPVFGPYRPSTADCGRINLADLNQLSAVSVPEATAERKVVESRPDRIWASCVGRTPLSRASDGSVSGGDVVWLVSFATSPAATSDSERMSTRETSSGFRTLVRSARLGDAQAQVVMDVHQDDHQTLLVVTVFDPQTGRPAARCGLAAARGDRAEDAVDWCLKAVSDQLLRRPRGPAGSGAESWQAGGQPSPQVS